MINLTGKCFLITTSAKFSITEKNITITKISK